MTNETPAAAPAAAPTVTPPPAAPPAAEPYIEPTESETAAEAAEAMLPEQFEFAEWRLTVKGNADTMTKLVERLAQTQVGRQLEQGRRLLASRGMARNG